MKAFPSSLSARLQLRTEANSLRKLPGQHCPVDFSSNDYLGFSKSTELFQEVHQFLTGRNIMANGATGSRLLSGNHILCEEVEQQIAAFHKAERALLFNSGYDANVGFLSSVPQRGDIILFDELSHASIRDGIQLSNARAYKFKHNDLEDLERLITRFQENQPTIYIVTESVFSMDGDSPELEQMVLLVEQYNCYLVIDEAHALGVFGTNGEGVVQFLDLHERVFARIMTFGKGLGCHGAVVLGCKKLQEYLVNFSRSFIYTTALSPHAVATIGIAYSKLNEEAVLPEKLKENIIHFNQEKNLQSLKPLFIRSKSAIQSAVIPGNERVKSIAKQFEQRGFDVKAILSPTVPEGQERLRFCIHSYNSKEEISDVLRILKDLV